MTVNASRLREQTPALRIVVFADGTGNAFSHQESNVWRLYQAVRQTCSDTAVRYIPGVGTQSIRPLAAIDGAIGLGVPANVRELYRFICWHWEPGAEIWMFGFSRGAFSIRTLAGLIHHEGLMPRKIGGSPVSEAIMISNSDYAWRSYRRKTAPTPFWTHPTIAVVRAALGVRWRLSKGRAAFLAAQKTMDDPANGDRRRPPIKFMGLFDTVEAFGMPVEELRPVVNRLIWPVSFRNERCSELVQTVRHVLAIDDERTTFHPVRFDQSQSSPGQSVQEVWFPGMHSDVGGGYPDDALSMVPLMWIAGEAAKLGLPLNRDAMASWALRASPTAPLHDSRAGAATLYRYDPRPVGDLAQTGGPPVLHHSVAMRVAHEPSCYGPVNLPDSFIFLPKEGERQAADQTAPQRAIQAISKPTRAILEHARDVVWWRRLHYFVMLGTLIWLACLPWLSPMTAAQIHETVQAPPWRPLGVASDLTAGVWAWLVDLAGAIAPAFAKPWLDALKANALQSALLIALFIWMYSRSAKLQRQIKDISRIAWRKPADGVPPAYTPLPSMAFARRLRSSTAMAGVYRFVTRRAIPFLLGVALVCAALILISRVPVSAATSASRMEARLETSTSRIARSCEANGRRRNGAT